MGGGKKEFDLKKSSRLLLRQLISSDLCLKDSRTQNSRKDGIKIKGCGNRFVSIASNRLPYRKINSAVGKCSGKKVWTLASVNPPRMYSWGGQKITNVYRSSFFHIHIQEKENAVFCLFVFVTRSRNSAEISWWSLTSISKIGFCAI